MLNPLFMLALALGSVGVQQFVSGAHAIARKDFFTMSRRHLVGAVMLTLSATATAVQIGDLTFLVMQPPFVIAALRDYLRRYPKSRFIVLLKIVDWWGTSSAIVVNLLLIAVSLLTGIVTTPFSFTQVIGAGIVSTGLVV